jgi:hypothetical protein
MLPLFRRPGIRRQEPPGLHSAGQAIGDTVKHTRRAKGDNIITPQFYPPCKIIKACKILAPFPQVKAEPITGRTPCSLAASKKE